jgi:hypothetical protein
MGGDARRDGAFHEHIFSEGWGARVTSRARSLANIANGRRPVAMPARRESGYDHRRPAARAALGTWCYDLHAGPGVSGCCQATSSAGMNHTGYVA